MHLAAEHGIDPVPFHRVAVIGAGALDILPHNGAVVTLFAVCGLTHARSCRDIVVTAIVGALIALVVVIVLGSLFGSFRTRGVLRSAGRPACLGRRAQFGDAALWPCGAPGCSTRRPAGAAGQDILARTRGALT